MRSTNMTKVAVEAKHKGKKPGQQKRKASAKTYSSPKKRIKIAQPQERTNIETQDEYEDDVYWDDDY